MEDFLSGKVSHKALQHKAGHSRILMGMAYLEYKAMDVFGIRTEDDWQALSREERARKVAYVQSSSIIEAVQSYEAAHKGNR